MSCGYQWIFISAHGSAKPSGASYIIKRLNSDEQQVLVHVDEINSFRGEGVYKRTRSGKQATQSVSAEEQAPAAVKSRKKKSEVEMIMAEQDHSDHGKRYLVMWSGEDDEGERWPCSWELQEDMDCDERVAEFKMTSKAVRKERLQQATEAGITDVLEESSDEEGDSSSENEEEEGIAGVEEVRREVMAMQQEDCSMCKDCFHLCRKSLAAVAHAEDV